MIEELKNKRYQFQEQIEVYNRKKNKLSHKEKFDLVNNLVKEDIFAYLELISSIVFDIAEVSKEYIVLLETITEKVKNDMAQGPFLNSLKDIGIKKEKTAIKLYDKMLKESKNETLVILSGLILGGYAIKNKKELIKRLKEEASDLVLCSYLKSILVVYENKKLTKEIYNFLDKIEKSKEDKLLIELANISVAFYKKDKKYFYNKILNLIKLKKDNISGFVFSKFSYLDLLNKEQLFNLIEISKDSKEYVIDEMLKILKKYPKEHKRISELLIYWLSEDLEFKLKYFDWVLEDLAKKNKLFIKYFLDNYKRIRNKKYKSYIVTFPHLFVTLSKHNISYSIKQVFRLDLKNKEQEYLFYELNRKIIGNIYQDNKYFKELVTLISNLKNIVYDRDFITFNEKKFKEKSNTESKENYDYLINVAYDTLSKLQNRKKKYKFSLITKNIKKYALLYKIAKEVINKSKSTKSYSPLLWLGETEEPDFSDIKISEKDDKLNRAFKLDFARNRYWSRAYLDELNRDLNLIDKYPNGKFKKQDTKKEVIKRLSNENDFWRLFSELIFIKKFNSDKKMIKEIEPKVPGRQKNNLDLKIHLFDRNIYFEVTQPEMDRSLKLANGAVALGNKAFSTIDKKYRQLFSKPTLEEIKKGQRKDLFFVVIDRSSSTIDEHQLMDSFLGSLAYTWQIDKTTGKVVNQYMTRKQDSFSHRNKNTDIISGAIFFKKELIFINNEPKIRLNGNIIQNPSAINSLSEKEIEELKKIIFR